MKKPIQECTDLRMLALLFPRCDNPATVADHLQTILYDVAVRAAKRLETAEADLQSTEQYIEHLHQVLGITGTPKAEVMKDPEYLRRRWVDSQAALEDLLDLSGSEEAKTDGSPVLAVKTVCTTEDLLESVAAVKNSLERMCHSISSVFNKGVE